MKARLRSRLWLISVPLAALGIALALLASQGRGQPLPGEPPECSPQAPGMPAVPAPGEPPMVDAPSGLQTPHSPDAPFTPPFPTPLPPGQQTGPFAPDLPFVPAAPTEPPQPVVRLRVQAPAKVQPDKEIEYHLTVENVSRADAHHVLVRDRLARGLEEKASAEPKETRRDLTKNGATDFIWELGTLKAGAKKDIVLTLKPKGAEEVQNSAYVQFEHGQTVKTKITQPALGLRMSAPPDSALPNPVVIRLEVTNNGETPAQDVVLECELPERLVYGKSEPPVGSEKPLLWKLGTLRPGQTRRVELEAIPTQAGSYACQARVTAAGGLKKEARVNVTVSEAKISIHTSGPKRRLVNRPVPFLITVSNPGTMPLTNVQVADEVPPGLQFESASANGRLQQGQVRWSLGTLGPGEKRSLRMVVHAPEPGWCGNAATVSADPKLFDKARSDLTHIDAALGPAVEIDKSFDGLEVGQKAAYTIRLLNLGKEAVFRTQLVVTVPDELSIRGQRGKTAGQREGQIVRFDKLELLAPNQPEEYVVEVEAIKPGEARLRVRLTDDRPGTGTPEEWEDTTTIRAAAANSKP